MSSNILNPLVNAAYNYGKWFMSAWISSSKINFDSLFKNIGFKNKEEMYPKLIKKSDEEFYRVFEFNIPTGMCINDFKKKVDLFAQILNVKEKYVSFEKKGYNVIVKARNNKKPNYDYDIDKNKRKDFKIPLGIDFDGNIVLCDLLASKNYGCLISGASGSGKSVSLRVILCHLVNNKNKRDLQLVIQNVKRVDLKMFKDVKHTIAYNVGTEGVEDLLEDQLEEMNRRYEMFEKNDCDDIWEYRKLICKIPFRLVVIEEISNFEKNKEYQTLMTKLISQGRGAGIIPIMCSQLPTYTMLPNVIRCNLGTVIGLNTSDSIRSEIICGEKGLEKLEGEGHSKLYDKKNKGKEYQGFQLSKEQMKEICDKNSKNNNKSSYIIKK